jgi:iron complex outermembrane receptor protein
MKALFRRKTLSCGSAALVLGLASGAFGQQRSFDVPSEDAASAIADLARQAGVQIIAPADQLKGVKTPAIKGQLDVRAALRSLLARTSLSIAADDGTVITLRRQGDATPEERDSTSQAVAEVIVTATRRSENAQTVPISITALSEHSLQDSGALRMEDVVHAVPGLAFNENLAGNASLSIRGVSTTSSTAYLQSPVALYMDEVPLLNPAAGHAVPGLPLFDINHVEVLRGPQGTLFGSGALGGAIREITNKPDMTRYQAATEETLETRAIGGPSYATNLMVNLPVVQDKLALRVVGSYNYSAGWIDNSTRGEKDVNHEFSGGGRAELRWTPADNLSFIGTFVDESDRPSDSAYTPYYGKGYIANSTLRQYSDNDTKIYNLVGEYRMPWGTLTSSTSYVNRSRKELSDDTTVGDSLSGLSTPVPVTDVGLPTDDFIQEVRLASTNEHPYKWLVGGYYRSFQQKLTEVITQAGSGAVFASQGFPSDTLENNASTFTIDEEALFGEASYDITRQITATAGVRVFHESVAIAYSGNGYFDGGPVDIHNSAQYTKATPKFALSYTPARDVLIYVQAAEGYRAGQGNSSPPRDPVTGQPIPAAYGPDQLWNYELGAKTSLFGHKLTIDGAIYYIDWSQIQLQQHTPSGTVYSANAGSATVKGVELQIAAKPVSALEVGTSLSYDEGRMTAINPGVRALVGDQLPGSAPFTAYAYGQYNFQINDSLDGFIRADYSYTGKEFSDLNNPTSLLYGNYGSVGAQWGLKYKNFDALLFAENLGDGSRFINARRSLSLPVAIRQTPRTIGLTLRAYY